MRRMEMHRSAIAFALIVLGACGGGGDKVVDPQSAAHLSLVTAPSTVADTRIPLDVQPVLQVVDGSGRALTTAVTVTAAVSSGNAKVLAGASATTDANGRAMFAGLALGSSGGAVGSVTLEFSAPGLGSTSAVIELRCAVPPLAIGGTVDGTLAVGDCPSPRGAYVNAFAVTTSQPVTAVRLSLAQQGLSQPFLGTKAPDEPKIYWGWSAPGRSSFTFRALLPPGRNQVEVSSLDPQAGTYRLTVSAAAEDLTCEEPQALLVGSLSTAQQLDAADCSDASGYVDAVLIGLAANASLTASMSATHFDPSITLVDAAAGGVAAAASAAGTARLTFVNGGANKAFFLLLRARVAGDTGPYTLGVALTPPS